MDLNRALEYALNGEAVLFVGAGFSVGATNSRGLPLKTGGRFAEHLATLAGLPKELSLDEVSEEFLRDRGKDALLTELRGEFSVQSVAETHERISSIPWRRIYTTNYDDVLEVAHKTTSRPVIAVTMSDDVRSIPKRSDTLAIHLNGYVGKLTRSNVTSEIKLTDTSYLTAAISSSEWAVLFRQDLAMASAIFFVGYSLYDLDIRRILVEDPALKAKSFFVLGAAPDVATSRRASRFGQVVGMGAEDLAQEFEKKKATYTPPENVGPTPFSVRPYNVRARASAVADREVFELLLWGNVRSDLVWQSLHRGPQYFLEREVARSILKLVKKGGRHVVVHSHLANGKSLVVEGIKSRLYDLRWKVYTAVVKGDTLYAELESLLKTDERVVIVFEDYSSWFDAIEFVTQRASDQVTLILTARTAIHEVNVDRLASAMNVDSIPEFSVDVLTPGESNWLVNLFDTYGLWGEQTAWGRSRKNDWIRKTCRSELHAVLLKLLESPHIIKKFEAIFDQVNSKHDHHEAIVTALVLTVLGHPASVSMLADLTGDGVLSAEFRRNEVIRQLFDFDRGEVRLRSAVAAEFVLKRISDPNMTVDILIRLARATDAAARASYHYRGLFRTLMRFQSIQEVLPDEPRGLAILRYYESIKNLESARREPLFWLQYAIAALFLEQFDRAAKYFDAAYSLAAARPNYNTFQIDNHYARYLLSKAVREMSKDEAIAAFRTARQTINDQIKRERTHYYPYRVARLYRDFYEHFEGEFSSDERDEVLRAAGFVIRRIAELPADRRKQRYIADCARSLEAIVPDDLR